MVPTLADWLHDWGPWLVRLPGTGFGLRWYGLSYVAGFVVGWWLIRLMSKRGMTPIPASAAADVVLWAALGAIVGGRLFYCLIYQPSLLLTFEPSFPFWGGLMVNRGGMASHGGMIGVCFAAWRISRGFKNGQGERVGVCPPVHVMDVLALATGPGLFFGRVANFINGELLGKVVAGPGELAPWWAVRYPQEHLSLHAPTLTPGQEEQMLDLVRTHAPAATEFGPGYELVLEKLQAGGANATRIAEQLAPLVSARHPSQLYQAIAEGVVTTIVVWLLWARPRALGVISGAWLITYGVLRVLTETVRLPDDHLAVARIAGLSRGQWLSVGMVVVGILLIAFGRRLSRERFGGWRKPQA